MRLEEKKARLAAWGARMGELRRGLAEETVGLTAPFDN
jgi:hypothetical protein